jgi:hypothetical protein
MNKRPPGTKIFDDDDERKKLLREMTREKEDLKN